MVTHLQDGHCMATEMAFQYHESILENINMLVTTTQINSHEKHVNFGFYNIHFVHNSWQPEKIAICDCHISGYFAMILTIIMSL